MCLTYCNKSDFLIFPILEIRVSDPYFLIRIRIQTLHFRLNTDPNPDLMTKNWKKFTAEKKKNFWSKTAIYLSLGLNKGRPSYKRSLQLSKENLQHFKTWNFLIFSTFVGHFCPPGFGSGFRIRNRIRIHWPDWIRIHYGSWSETLVQCYVIFTNH